MKNLKRKIAVGAVCLSLVIGAGSAFASTNAGAQLQAWYNARFDATKTEMQGEVTTHANTYLQSLPGWYNGVKNDAIARINTAATDEGVRASDAITAAVDDHIASVGAQKGTILTGMPGQFDGLFREAETRLNQEAIKYAKIAENNLTNSLNTAGNNGITAVTDKVTPVKESAVASLQQEIGDAKAAINTELDKEQENTVGEINSYIDRRVVEEKTVVTNKIAELEKTNIDNITDKGEELEAAALLDLQALVDAIDD